MFVVVMVALATGRAYAGQPWVLTAGNGTSCFSGSVGMWCWGRNDVGQLGDGTTTDRPSPVRYSFAPQWISAGDRNVCHSDFYGTPVYCSGANDHGQIGDGTTTERHGFTQVSTLSALAVGAAGYFTAGDTFCIEDWNTTSTGDAVNAGIYCWGANQFGTVGDGTTTDRSSSALILPAGHNVASSGGGGHACAYTYENSTVELWCWGNNVDDSLGLGPNAGPMSTTPVQVSVPGGFKSLPNDLAVGVHHSCAISADSKLWCWGLNDHGQLGDGTTNSSAMPVQVQPPGTDPFNQVWVSPSGGFTCATAGYQTYCWGRNDRGQLGDGTTTEHHAPTTQVILPEASGNVTQYQIAVGENHACSFIQGIKNSMWFRCWGANDHGQIGDGTTVDRPVPALLTLAPIAPPPTTSVPSSDGKSRTMLLAGLLVAGMLAWRQRRAGKRG
jgi:alpha-tubulin suppressor-like RCC1 family protein